MNSASPQRHRDTEKAQKTIHESVLLAHIYERSRDLMKRFPQVIAGPGHDCAVVKSGRETLLLKVDQVIEGRHFVAWPKTPLKLIARKAIARAVSDIAASGGKALCGLAAAAIPAGFVKSDELFDWVHRFGNEFGCPIVGGDIAKTDGPLSISISVVGTPHPNRGPVLRDGAKAGDFVYVTGRLGNTFDEKTGRGKHLSFVPRLKEAAVLCDRLGKNLHAMMDVSDGIGKDAARMAEMSEVSIALNAEAIPLARGVKNWRHAMGGEDYELFFAARGEIPTKAAGTMVTRIGRVVKREKVAVWMEENGKQIGCDAMGWEH